MALLLWSLLQNFNWKAKLQWANLQCYPLWQFVGNINFTFSWLVIAFVVHISYLKVHPLMLLYDATWPKDIDTLLSTPVYCWRGSNFIESKFNFYSSSQARSYCEVGTKALDFLQHHLFLEVWFNIHSWLFDALWFFSSNTLSL